MNNNLFQNPNYYNLSEVNMHNNYVEEYLKKNIGKNIEAHVSFCDSIEWRDSIFKGKLDSVGKDYLTINNSQNTYVIWNIYIDYIVIK